MDRVYRRELRPMLSPWSQTYWDDHLHFFSAGRRNSFYYHGTSGVVAWALNNYLDRTKGLRAAIDALLNAQSLEEQRDIYYGELQSAFWNRFIRWVCGRDMALSLVGVPQAQRRQVERHYTGGIAQFIEECIEAVFAWLPLGDNYFWRVYLTGEYTRDCCPEYLRQENFEHLQGGLVDCVQVDTDTVEGFLRKTDVPISRFVLLDHMDWLSTQRRPLLQAEWQAIVDRAAPDARILWRSGGLKVDFVDPLMVSLRGQQQRVGELLSYHDELAQELHQKDRVHTYGSFYIADLATG
jgi:S-adenosylmethionine-diacylglycerol 3-amino-3-carboxypropyl transferase